jgi:hypothetical protein
MIVVQDLYTHVRLYQEAINLVLQFLDVLLLCIETPTDAFCEGLLESMYGDAGL